MCEACTEFHPLWPPMRKPKAESETKPEGESRKPETESRKPKAEHLKPKAENQKRKQSENGGRKPKAGNRKPKAETESRKPKTESRKRDESESERVSADRNSQHEFRSFALFHSKTKLSQKSKKHAVIAVGVKIHDLGLPPTQ